MSITLAPAVQKSAVQTSDPRALTQILSRLEPKILSTDPHNALRYSAFERTKTLANLEYARTLLLRSEHTAASIKVQNRKHALQETLLRQRALIKKLSDRLFELGQLDDGQWGSDNDLDEDDDVDHVLNAVLEDSDDGASQDKDQANLIKTTNGLGSPRSPRTPREAHPPAHTSKEDSAGESLAERRAALLSTKNTEQSQSGLRSRATAPSNKRKSDITSAGTTTSLSTNSKSSTIPSLESAESVQNDLTSSLVSLAEQLKLSAQAFSDDLAADAEALSRTEDALGKNKTGLDGATQRMGVLRRMSEGRWWWGRMVLYAIIMGLWVLLVLLVFVGPKIRF